MLSQINAARGEDAIDVDAKSESESEEEVRVCGSPTTCTSGDYIGGGIFFSGFIGAPGSAQAHSRVLSSQVGPSCYWPLSRCLPRSPRALFPHRAQNRVAEQKLDSKLPLSRIIDIRKRVFADVKVCRAYVRIIRNRSSIL